VSFASSFRTTGGHADARKLMKQADSARLSLSEALVGSSKGNAVSHKTIVRAARDYLPLMNRILVTCKVQPEAARLDEKLLFEWSSGVEHNRSSFRSEALMFELVMLLATEALGLAGNACDESSDGNFAAASREFKAAAGMMDFLAEDQLPKWIARGSSVEDDDLPSEITVGVCAAFRGLFLATAQQMAVTTVLVRPGVPNYGLLAKLTLGVAEGMESFFDAIKSKASRQMEKMDTGFFHLISFQANLQRALSLYFQARALWDTNENYGLAIRLLHEAMQFMRVRDKSSEKGLPDTGPKSSLKALGDDTNELRHHMKLVLATWEKDNSAVYFEKVPQIIPESEKLPSGIMMMKPELYELGEADPVPLSVPASAMASPPVPVSAAGRMSSRGSSKSAEEMSDEELARALAEDPNFLDGGRGGGDGGGRSISVGSVDDDPPPPYTSSGGSGGGMPPPPSYSSVKPVMNAPPRPSSNLGSKKSTYPGNRPRPATRGNRSKSDEEIARELQNRLNMGEDV